MLPHNGKVPSSTLAPGRGLSMWSLDVLRVFEWVLSRFLPQSKDVQLVGF